MRVWHAVREAGRKPGPLFVAACLASPAAQAALEPYFELDTLAFAEPVPIEEFRKDWAAPLASGGDALMHARVESGVRMGAWSVGYVHRADYELQASDGAAALYHRARNRGEFAIGERFDLEVAAWHLESHGVRVARHQEYSRELGLDVALSLLEGTALTDGGITGTATAVGPEDYDYQAQVQYRYSEDALFERTVGRPYGRGYSLDVGAAGSRWNRLQWRIEARDVFGRMRWEAAPATLATATSDNKEYGADGYVRYNPALSGQEGFQAFDQRIHARGTGEATWQLHGVGYGVRVRATEVHVWPGLLSRGAVGPSQWELELNPRERVLGVGLSWRGLSLRWQADRLSADEARYLSGTISFHHAYGAS